MSSYLRSLAAGDLGPTSRFPRQAYHGRGLVCFGCGLGVVWLPGLWPDLSGVWSVEVYKIFTQQKIQPIMDHTCNHAHGMGAMDHNYVFNFWALLALSIFSREFGIQCQYHSSLLPVCQ